VVALQIPELCAFIESHVRFTRSRSTAATVGEETWVETPCESTTDESKVSITQLAATWEQTRGWSCGDACSVRIAAKTGGAL